MTAVPAPHPGTTMQDVVSQIHRLHAPVTPTSVQEATQWLMQWSNGCTWESLIVLLKSGMTGKDVLVFFFAANLLAQKAQSGKSASAGIADSILEVVMAVGDGDKVVKRQLCVAYADLALYGHASLEKAVQTLQREHYTTMLEMLKIFPEEVKSTKVTVDAEQRMKLVSELLMSQEQVFDALAQSDTDTSLKLQATEQWLSLPTPQVIASKESGAKFTAEIIRRRCYEHPLLQKAAVSLSGEDCEVGEAACGTLIALVNLTNEYSELVAPALELVANACINLAKILQPQIDPNSWLPYGPTSPNRDAVTIRMNFVSRILCEMGPHFVRALAARGVGAQSAAPAWCEHLGEVALHWLQIRQVDLARGGLEFWYTAIVSDVADKELLHPWMEKFTYACLKCTRYPVNPEAHAGFETDHFVRFREQCNQCLTEAVASVLPVSWVIHVVGEQIGSLTEWNDLDAAVFILTGVAPRARAGQDQVIPRLIERIPHFPYPSDGLPALLLRISAGRLILYTAGYLAFKEEALVPTLRFLLQSLLPALPRIQCPDKDLKQYAQAICTDALRSTTQAAKDKLLDIQIDTATGAVVAGANTNPPSSTMNSGSVAAGGGQHNTRDNSGHGVAGGGPGMSGVGGASSSTATGGENGMQALVPGAVFFWQQVITNIVDLVLHGDFHADVRPQLVFPVGHIIGGMRDYKQLENTLAEFVARLQPSDAVFNFPANKEGKGPPELKLYLAALSCCYDVKMPDSESRHPVLAFWEQQWQRIEQMTKIAVERDWEDYVEQFCLSLNFIFQSAQTHAISSPLLFNSLDLLGQAAEVRPCVHYYSLVRTVMGLFAPHGIREVDEQLVLYLGRFATPVGRIIRTQGGAKAAPEIIAACFEMLGDALRWSNLANGSLSSGWLPDVFDAALEFLTANAEIATHEQALTAVLRFFCSFLRWASEGPDVVKLAKQLWETDARIQKLIHALLQLMASCADNPKATTVGGVAEVIRPMLQGPLEFEAKTCLKDGLQHALPPMLKKSPMDAQKLVDTLAISKPDQRRFHKILYDLAENFHTIRKRGG